MIGRYFLMSSVGGVEQRPPGGGTLVPAEPRVVGPAPLLAAMCDAVGLVEVIVRKASLSNGGKCLLHRDGGRDSAPRRRAPARGWGGARLPARTADIGPSGPALSRRMPQAILCTWSAKWEGSWRRH